MPNAKPLSPSFVQHFGAIEDPRKEGMCDHPLMDILGIAIVGVICGADGWDEIRAFAEDKREFLSELLELPKGIPSVRTVQRVFARLRPRAFEAAFRGWVGVLAERAEGRLVALDGKTVRGVAKRSIEGQSLHLVHAWATENRLLLGQLATDIKSNEITAIPERIKLLDLEGAVVTTDAMGCQTAIVHELREAGADYILAVKGNQPELHDLAEELFHKAAVGDRTVPTQVALDDTTGHGRVERRRIVATPAPSLPARRRWEGLACFIAIESERRTADTTAYAMRSDISSLPYTQAALAGRKVRDHGSVENPLHWHLDN